MAEKGKVSVPMLAAMDHDTFVDEVVGGPAV
jgi:hypothetical protein